MLDYGRSKSDLKYHVWEILFSKKENFLISFDFHTLEGWDGQKERKFLLHNHKAHKNINGNRYACTETATHKTSSILDSPYTSVISTTPRTQASSSVKSDFPEISKRKKIGNRYELACSIKLKERAEKTPKPNCHTMSAVSLRNHGIGRRSIDKESNTCCPGTWRLLRFKLSVRIMGRRLTHRRKIGERDMVYKGMYGCTELTKDQVVRAGY